jgi:hypothetical protein
MMSDLVKIALIAAVPATVSAVAALVAAIKLHRVEKIINQKFNGS